LLVDTVLYNAKISTNKGLFEAGIAIDEDRIVKVAKRTNLPKGSKQFNLRGNLALPGFIDSHVHLRDQRLAYREDFASGTSAAAVGGITTVVDMPNNSPVTMSAATLTERMQLAESCIFVNVAFNSALPEQLYEIHRIVKTGAVGFKLYLNQQIGGIDVTDANALLKAFNEAHRAKTPVAVHAEDKSVIEQRQMKLVEQGRDDVCAFLQVHSPEVEEKATKRVLELSRRSGVHLHVCHVTSQLAMRAIVKAKRLGYNVTCEVTPHHLLLTSEDLKKYGKPAIAIPPLRKPDDLAYLWRQLQRGLVDTIASDHAPHSLSEKQAESIWDVKPGIVGLETMIPLLLAQVNKGCLTIRQLVRLASKKPAEIYHMKYRGTVAQGSYADITVVDLKKEYQIDASKFHSRAKFSPFDGWKVKGMPVKTLANGRLVMDEGEIVARLGTGRIIRSRVD